MSNSGAQRSPAFDSILGRDSALRDVLARAALVAPTTMTVLVTGESGSGKELVARALHELGPSPDGPYVVVNCATLPRELAESELFGHERGAFTGAAGRRAGWFEEASGGTLVLDEIGELPPDLQPKLLRALESGRVRRVGGGGEVTVRVRVVAMTLRDLGAEVRRGTFRLDLYHRLGGVTLALPPLRQRRADIPLLARHFLREVEAEVGPRELDEGAERALAAHDWPGNVRELRNVVRRAAILAGARIDASSLELDGEAAPAAPFVPACELRLASRAADGDGDAVPRFDESAADVLSLAGRSFLDIERAVLTWALRRHGSRRQAARALGVSRSTFCDKAKRYGIG